MSFLPDQPTAMLSAGYCLLPVDFRVIAAKTSVSPPTRPIYIKIISIIFEIVANPGVIPMERPTVPTAEALSNKVLRNGICSILHIAIAPTSVMMTSSINTATAPDIASDLILRLKTAGDFSCFNTEIMVKTRCTAYQHEDNSQEYSRSRKVVIIRSIETGSSRSDSLEE